MGKDPLGRKGRRETVAQRVPSDLPAQSEQLDRKALLVHKVPRVTPAERVQLGQQALKDVFTWMIAVLAFVILLRFKWNSVWLILAGAFIGLLRFWLLKG